MRTLLSLDISRHFSGVATTMAALPSAGWVWPPKVTVPSGMTGRSLPKPSAVDITTPSSPCSAPALFLKLADGTSNGSVM